MPGPAPMVRLLRVSFAYDGRHDVLSDATLQLESGWTGVVGPNGGGKTTLLRLLHTTLRPTAGDIEVHPRGACVRACPQRVEHLDPIIETFGESWTAPRCGCALAWRSTRSS